MNATDGQPTAARTLAASMDLWPDSPFRPVDWRWARARELAFGPGRRQRWDDDRVIQAHRFFLTWRRVGGELTGPGLAGEDPAILGAVQLLHGSPRRRWELEARILARQTDEEIGSRLGVPTPVIEAYESLFFAVRDKLQASDWIMCDAIGPRIYEGLGEGDLDLIWKLWAYRGGPLVLDALIAYHDACQGGTTDTLDPAMVRRCRLIVAVTVLSPDDDPGEVLRLRAMLDQLEAETAQNDVAAAPKPVVILSSDVRIDPEPVREVRAGCALEAPNPDDCDGITSPASSGSAADNDLGTVLRPTG
jgi:hypothetical protein